jgi:pimeloyl-ACP methyl ester carboxylesterase
LRNIFALQAIPNKYAGGPGESGVESILGAGELFAKRWGYNVVAIDPRGVGLSEPKISCSYSNNTALRRRQTHALGNLTETWNTNLQQNHACAVANEHTAAKYVGTSAVVQDMMHYTELQAAARGKDAKKALVNYYGVSYGTAIGQTLVAMYPDRLRRVLLDGNVYGVAHYQGWEPSGIDDLAHGIWLFAKLCYEAGGQWCPLAEEASSADEVKARFDLAVATLKLHPLTVNDQPYDDNAFLAKVQQSMYAPRNEQFSKLANMTIAALAGDATHLRMAKRDNPTDTSNNLLEIITGVDIAGRYPWSTYAEWIAAANELQETAPYGAQNYASTNG